MRAEWRDALEFVYADDTVASTPQQQMRLAVARGGTISAHILIDGLTAGEALTMRVRRSGHAVSEAEWFRLQDVPVEKNTGPVGFIEKPGERNEFVTRRAPFRVYDVLVPTPAHLPAPGSRAVLRLHIPVLPSATPETRSYTVDVKAGNDTATLALEATVHRSVIPPVGRDSFPYTNWFNYELIATRHGLKPWTPEHWAMLKSYAELMARTRQNTFWITLGTVFEQEKGRPVLNRTRLRHIVKTFTDAGLYFIEGGHVAGRTGGEWKATTFDLSVAKVRATSVAGNAALADLCGQLAEEIGEHDWEERWLQHVTDEPTDANAADYRILAGMVRKYLPGVPILDATMHVELAGAVDIWCPQAQEFQRHEADFRAFQALGDRVWFYTCCFPGGPWLNRLLDQELLRPALFGWGAARFGLQGFLHWGFNHYRHDQDPFQQSVVDHGGGNNLPAGDTHVVYPGTDGPWSSLRLEAQREGCEDYELLRLLQKKDPKQAATIIHQALRAFDDYTKDPVVLRSARRALLLALD